MLHRMLRASAAIATIPSDTYFKNTSLLLLGNGSNGAQNNTFLDGSSNNTSFTRYGNVTQGSFSPFSAPDGKWANYFRGAGAGDKLQIAHSSEITIGTQSFWIEAWVFPTAFIDEGIIAQRRQYYNVGVGSWTFYINANASIVFVELETPGNFTISTANNSLSLNTWTHIAVSRDSTNTFRIYINGVSSATTTPTSSFNFSNTNPLYIGWDSDARNNSFAGYISNFRMGVGSALYSGSSSFSVPTSPLTAVPNTKVLTCQSNRFKDNSSNAFTISVGGLPAITPSSPFAPTEAYSANTNGGSGYFDGSGDYLIGASSPGVAPGSSAFTWECWFYPTDTWGANSQGGDGIFIVEAVNGIQIGKSDNSQNLWGIASLGVAWRLRTSTHPTIGQWNHMAITRSGTGSNQGAIFLNGVRVAQGTIPDTFVQSTVQIAGSPGYEATGYISDMRLIIGSALYDPASSTYTMPTAPLTAVSGTGFLMNFTNAGVIDSTGRNIIETAGDAQISTSVKKYGTGSLKFDGTGDYLSIPNNPNHSFGTGDFTVECWVYLAGNSSPAPNGDRNATIVGNVGASGIYSQPGWDFTILGNSSTTGIGLNFGNRTGPNTVYNVSANAAISQNTWHHCAVVRSSTTITFYLNGLSIGTATLTDQNISSTYPLLIGKLGAANNYSYELNGYIDDLRITKYARYTSSFTPPSALPAR